MFFISSIYPRVGSKGTLEEVELAGAGAKRGLWQFSSPPAALCASVFCSRHPPEDFFVARAGREGETGKGTLLRMGKAEYNNSELMIC